MSIADSLPASTIAPRRFPEARGLLELTKPITWFPPMWAYCCGLVSAGVSPAGQWHLVILGLVLAGPLVCGMSQVANDWCDRFVDAINEPHRPIPSGRVPPGWALAFAVFLSGVSLWAAWYLGPWGFGATVIAVMAAWAYSLPPVRLKRSGWWGPGLVGLSYETLPWITGVAVLSIGSPAFPAVVVALLYGIGAHGIMTLNDFKALEGDRQTGVRSLPVTVGPDVAAKIACIVMTLPQAVIIALLVIWDRGAFAAVVSLSLVLQMVAMRHLMRDPKGKAPWYNATGVSLYVSGMMISAFAIRSMGG